jgi:hypothetical protein
MEYLQIIVQIAVSLAALIPLVIELVKYVQKAVKEKNWQSMVKIALDLMGEAEEKFSTGAERKEWVIAMVEKSAESINYELDTASLGTLIDNIIALTNKVNTDKASAETSEEK